MPSLLLYYLWFTITFFGLMFLKLKLLTSIQIISDPLLYFKDHTKEVILFVLLFKGAIHQKRKCSHNLLICMLRETGVKIPSPQKM